MWAFGTKQSRVLIRENTKLVAATKQARCHAGASTACYWIGETLGPLAQMSST